MHSPQFLLEHYVSRETFDKYKIYKQLLVEWNRNTSLVHVNTLEDFYNRHVLDSLQIIPLIKKYYDMYKIRQEEVPKTPTEYISNFFSEHTVVDFQNFIEEIAHASILDIGTGAGFPGMALAICGFRNITVCDTNERKCFFLEKVANKTGTKIEIINNQAANIDNKFDIVISRAVCSLSNLLPILQNVSRETFTHGIFHKGESYNAELLNAIKEWEFDSNCFESITNSKSRIISIYNLKKR